MNLSIFLIAFAAIVVTCVFLNKVSSKLGVPVLLLFILLGVLLGWTTEVNMQEADWANTLCSAALIFIMFYGGFGTNWKAARPIAVEAGLLATLGVFATAGLVGTFCHYALSWSWQQSLLLGAVTSSTDAASVFSILRTRRLGLRAGTAPLLEIESGSNDPCSYMSTMLMIAIIKGSATAGGVAWMLVAQFLFGILGGFVVFWAARWVLHRFSFSGGFDMMFLMAVAMLAYALPDAVGGNGYLSVYITGILLGNHNFQGRKPLVNFFDGVTTLMQILIFFILGVMFHSEDFWRSLLPALCIFAFLTLLGRPLAVHAILLPFKRIKFYPAKQRGFISFVGLRGAASIVFAITILTDETLQLCGIDCDLIFDTVFTLVLISIALQGSLIPWAAKAFDMLDQNEDVMRTFSDFSDEADMTFTYIRVKEGDTWDGVAIKDLKLPLGLLIATVVRDGLRTVPSGDLVLQPQDLIVMCSRAYQGENYQLRQHTISENSRWDGKAFKDYREHPGSIVLLLQREGETIVPNGNTIMHSRDVLTILEM